MIDVKADNGTVQITVPTDGMSAEQINDFVTWLRVEAITRRSKLTPPGRLAVVRGHQGRLVGPQQATLR